jgi:hypothetical protein
VSHKPDTGLAFQPLRRRDSGNDIAMIVQLHIFDAEIFELGYEQLGQVPLFPG